MEFHLSFDQRKNLWLEHPIIDMDLIFHPVTDNVKVSFLREYVDPYMAKYGYERVEGTIITPYRPATCCPVYIKKAYVDFKGDIYECGKKVTLN
jgi:hypothetical protein